MERDRFIKDSVLNDPRISQVLYFARKGPKAVPEKVVA
jgi:hypothetical protein